jgi:hypothetical protein
MIPNGEEVMSEAVVTYQGGHLPRHSPARIGQSTKKVKLQ